MFGWDLPPGVTMRHIDEAAGADRDPNDRPRCRFCSAFLRAEPDDTRELQDTQEADEFNDQTGRWEQRTYPVTIRQEVRRCRRCGCQNVTQDL